MIYMLKYHPYKSDKPGKKYYIITNDNKKVYFGQASASDFTIHKDEQRKQRYIYIDTNIMKIGQNLVLILQGSGRVGCFGINQQ